MWFFRIRSLLRAGDCTFLFVWTVADIAVAVNAGDVGIRFFVGVQNRVNETLMTPDADFLKDLRVAFFDHDRFVEILQCEALRMVITVLGFGDVLADQIMRNVAVIADGDVMMAGLLPGVVLVIHDVAIGAGFGVVGKISEGVGVRDGIADNAERTANDHGDDGGKERNFDEHSGSPDKPGEYDNI